MNSIMKHRFLGTWKVDENDPVSVKNYGDVTMTFEAEGTLKYVVNNGKEQQIMLLTYEVQDDKLITDQPSSPQKETTRFEFISDDKLKLFFDGVESNFIRSKEKEVKPLKKWLGGLFGKD